MNGYERGVLFFARTVTVAFVLLTFVTFSWLYGWLHPGLWAIQTCAFIVFEGLFYLIRGSRTRVDMAIALAMWASVGAWMSVEHLIVMVACIVVMRSLPEGWVHRAVSVLLVAGIGSLITFADINPWAFVSTKPWLHALFIASCVLNMLLVLVRETLPSQEGSLRRK